MSLKFSMLHWVCKYYQIYSSDDPGLTLTYFTARSNLIPCAFVWEKGKIEAKIRIEPPWDIGVKINSTVPGRMTKMASRPIYGKNILKFPSSEPRSR